MAGDWIKMRGNLWDDPRVSRLVDLTDSSEAAIVGALYWLWATADQHSADGVMFGLTTKSIDRKTGITGFADALISVGWLADHPEGVRIVRFEEHNGKSAKRRCSESVRKMSARNADKEQQIGAPREREEEEEESTPSVANATGGEPPKITDPDEIIFGYGVPLLIQAGAKDKDARSFLGGLRKHHGDSALIDKLRECIKAKPLQPLEWLAAALPPGTNGKVTPIRTPPPDNFESRDYGTRAKL